MDFQPVSSHFVGASSISLASAHGESEAVPLPLLSPQNPLALGFCGAQGRQLARSRAERCFLPRTCRGKKRIAFDSRLRARILSGSVLAVCPAAVSPRRAAHKTTRPGYSLGPPAHSPAREQKRRKHPPAGGAAMWRLVVMPPGFRSPAARLGSRRRPSHGQRVWQL